jgi:regulator of sigma E protease
MGAVVLVHEFGHFVAARAFGVRVDIFSFGFGPRLFGFKSGDTDFRCSAIPLGGYIRMSAGVHNDIRAVTSKPRWQRIIIALAGPSINVLLSIGLLTGTFMVRFPQRSTNHDPLVEWMDPAGAAAKAGILKGDRIVRIDAIDHPTWESVELKDLAGAGRPESVWVLRGDRPVHLWVTPIYDESRASGNSGWAQRSEVQIAGVVPGKAADLAGLRRGDILVSVNGDVLVAPQSLQEALAEGTGEPVEIVYRREGENRKVQVTAERAPSTPARWIIGVSLEPAFGFSKLPLSLAIVESVRRNMQMTDLIFEFLDGVFARRMSPRSIDGPIQIANISSQAALEGAPALLELMATISLNLAVLNLLPLPILDGGMISMLLVEAMLRRDLGFSVKETVSRVGLVFILVLTAFVIYNDISKLMSGG